MKIFRIIHNLIMDLKGVGVFLGGNVKTKYISDGAYDIVNTDYNTLKIIFKGEIGKNDVIVDVGCGKGRVINYFIQNNVHNNIVGVELDENMAAITRKRFQRYPNVTVITGTIIDNIPSNATIFYLYNPFNSIVMSKFKDKIVEMFYGKKIIKIIYYNPEHLNVFENDSKWKIEKIVFENMPYHHLAIIKFCDNN